MSTHPRPKVITMGPIVDMSRPQPKPVLDVRGMYGIGDCIFQRAVMRELMKRFDTVVLTSYYRDMFWDLERDGLQINIFKDKGRIRDSSNRSSERGGVQPKTRQTFEQIRLTYDKDMIHKYGSILAAMFASANLEMPARPDFSMAVKPEWTARWRLYFKQECARRKIKVTKPILVYRPIVLNTRWSAPARAPDPAAYDALYKTIRDKFFVVSICNLEETNGHKEWIIGPTVDADLYLHKGELDFAAMCGLFSDAAMAFTNPGFSPVIAHACKTPTVIVYGGNESFATTNSVGAHLAPTLAIDTDHPCPCHSQNHRCNKTITLPPAKKRVLEFTQSVLRGEAKMLGDPDLSVGFIKPRVLIFGTTYVDTPERAELTKLWYKLHSALNPDCDLLLVDSASPSFPSGWAIPGELSRVHTTGETPFSVYQFKDNVGHLSRNGPNGASSKGRDGWGRAFSMGLDYAAGSRTPPQEGAQRLYDYVVHIEGDSLFKHPVMPIIERMRREGTKVLTTPVKGTKREEHGWVETGLMFFDTEWLQRSKFTKSYDWPNRQEHPTPEKVIYGMLGQLGDDFKLATWAAQRGDKNQINSDNIHNLDWVSHVRNKVGLDDVKLFRKYFDRVLNKAVIPPGPGPSKNNDGPMLPPPPVDLVLPAKPVTTARDITGGMTKINLGCGTNKLAGWSNHDQEVNITKRLPFSDNTADYIFAEHVVEHIPYYTAINFFKECLRVLKPNGVLRITTPSLEFLQQRGDQPYFDWVHERKWAPTADRRGAMQAILYCHGHQTAWTSSLLMSTMFYCGFDQTAVCEVGKSKHSALVGVEGHSKVIGEHFNWIESLCVEGTKS